MTNLLADFAVRFNASIKRNVEYFYIPYSNLNLKVVQLLLKYNCICSFSVDWEKSKQKLQIKILPVYLLSESLVRSIHLVSKPGRRIYWSASQLSLQFSRNNFQGFYIISTPRGICSSNELISAKILNKPSSGEVLLKINF